MKELGERLRRLRESVKLSAGSGKKDVSFLE